MVYRYPRIVPLLSVSGSHYEMGLQYGTLLKSEIINALKDYEKLLRWMAKDEGVHYRLLVASFRLKSNRIARKLPKRFHKEIKSIAKGSGKVWLYRRSQSLLRRDRIKERLYKCFNERGRRIDYSR